MEEDTSNLNYNSLHNISKQLNYEDSHEDDHKLEIDVDASDENSNRFFHKKCDTYVEKDSFSLKNHINNGNNVNISQI